MTFTNFSPATVVVAAIAAIARLCCSSKSKSLADESLPLVKRQQAGKMSHLNLSQRKILRKIKKNLISVRSKSKKTKTQTKTKTKAKTKFQNQKQYKKFRKIMENLKENCDSWEMCVSGFPYCVFR